MTRVLGIISANYSSAAFGKLTKSRPIASMPFGGRYRFIDFPLTNMVNSNITTIGVITPYFYRSLMDHVGDGKPWGLARKRGGLFLMPGTVYGTGETDKRFIIRDIIRNRRIVDKSTSDYVLFCDASKLMNVSFSDFIDFHIKSGNRSSFMFDKNHRFLDCLIIGKEYLLDILKRYANSDDMDLADILKSEKQAIGEYVVTGYVGIIETLDDYVRVSMDLLNPKLRKEIIHDDLITKVLDEAPTLYKAGSDVSNSIVSSGCIIKGSVENSIISRTVRIDEGASVKNCIIMQRCHIGKDACLENVIMDKYCEIGDGVVLKGFEKPLVIEKHSVM